MSKILNFFDDAYYINLDSKVNRRELFETRSKEVGIEAKRFSAIQPSFDTLTINVQNELKSWEPMTDEVRNRSYLSKAGELGCALSHKAVVTQARDRGLQNVLIFEDDCKFLPAWKSEIESVVRDLATAEWDLMYFGGELNNDAIRVTDNLNWVANGGVYCTHSYAVNQTFFEKIINYDLNWCVQIDIFLLNSNSRKLVSKKMLTVQESGWSDIRQQNTDSAQEWCNNSWEKFVK